MSVRKSHVAVQRINDIYLGSSWDDPRGSMTNCILYSSSLLDSRLLPFQQFFKYFELYLYQWGLRRCLVGIMQLGARGNSRIRREENQFEGEAEMMPTTGPDML